MEMKDLNDFFKSIERIGDFISHSFYSIEKCFKISHI